jgi:hypothetical protein
LLVLFWIVATVRLHSLVWNAFVSNNYSQHGLILNQPHYNPEISGAKHPALPNRNLTSPLDIAGVWTPLGSKLESYPWCHLFASQASAPLPPQGLVYIKIDKASSSTLAGINIRLAHTIGKRTVAGGGKDSVCAHTYEHFHAWPFLSEGHDAPSTTTLLWTFLRHPGERALSQYFHFLVSRRGYGVTYTLLHGFLESIKNFQLRYVMVPSTLVATAAAATVPTLNLTKALYDILSQNQTEPSLGFLHDFVLERYSFIGLVERMDESLAVMKLLWNVEIGDLMVLSAKQAGEYDDGRYQGKCAKIVRPADYFHRGAKEQRLCKRIEHYLATSFHSNNLDYQLYRAANASLDMTIAMLGTINVDRVVGQLRSLRQRVESECQDEAVFPCSSNGTLQLELSAKNCYWYDSGCGYPCVDRVIRRIHQTTAREEG